MSEAAEVLRQVKELGAGVTVDGDRAALNDPAFVVGPKLRRQFARLSGEIALLTTTQAATAAHWRSDDGSIELDMEQMARLVEATNTAKAAGLQPPGGESWADFLQRVGFDGFIDWCEGL